MVTRMTLSNIDITLISSVTAYIFSIVATSNETVLASISAISAIIFCLTAIIKFIDLVIDKWSKWSKIKKG
jgi:hypothetical protein